MSRSKSSILKVETTRRPHRLTLELEARLFPCVDPVGDLAVAFDCDSFVTLRTAWHG